LGYPAFTEYANVLDGLVGIPPRDETYLQQSSFRIVTSDVSCTDLLIQSVANLATAYRNSDAICARTCARMTMFLLVIGSVTLIVKNRVFPS